MVEVRREISQEEIRAVKAVMLPEDVYQPFITATHASFATGEDGFFLMFSSIDFLHEEASESEVRLAVVAKIHLGNAAMREFLAALTKDQRFRSLAETVLKSNSEEDGGK